MSTLLEQLKNRRIGLGLKQKDMMLRVGVSRQQYQRLEAKGNPRLETLELLAKGLKTELMLIPQEKLAAVKAVLAGETSGAMSQKEEKSVDNPWKDILGDESE